MVETQIQQIPTSTICLNGSACIDQPVHANLAGIVGSGLRAHLPGATLTVEGRIAGAVLAATWRSLPCPIPTPTPALVSTPRLKARRSLPAA
jgi:hypothetical protein